VAELDGSAWHLDKRVPIATIGAIFLQAVALGWMASQMDGRINALEVYTNELKAARLRERMAISETVSNSTTQKFEHIDQQLGRVEDKVDRIAERLGTHR
jgi:hypothetical protein